MDKLRMKSLDASEGNVAKIAALRQRGTLSVHLA